MTRETPTLRKNNATLEGKQYIIYRDGHYRILLHTVE